MSLDAALGTASSGIRAVNQQLAVLSQNIANAATPGYAAESVALDALAAGGQGFGVAAAPASRLVDAALGGAVNAQTATVAGQQVTSAALSAVSSAQGATGAGQDLASLVGALNGSFTTLGADPSNQASQQAVVVAAGTLAAGINQQASAYAQARQSAQDGLVSDVASLNAALQSIGALSDQIITAKAQGQSTADLGNQRSAQETAAAQLAGLTFLPQADGGVTAVAGGLVVDTHAAAGPFSVAAAALQPGSSGPAVLLSGSAVTGQLTAGSIGARIALRDQILPQDQAGLDEFAATLATRLSNQGLTLFTDGGGNLPVTGGTPVQAGYVGFSGVIQVNPAVSASPRLVRDGTGTVAPGTGGAAGFTPNPLGGPAGFSTLITAVLQYGFGAEAQAGTAQPAPNTVGLGPSGTLALGFWPGTTLADFAANLVSSQAQAANTASTALSNGQALQTALQAKLQSATGVSTDTELSHMLVLQNAYGANARIIAAEQQMWTSLINAVNAAAA